MTGLTLISIRTFLPVSTPRAWLDAAAARLPELLNDHANCELKAASTALAFIYRYPERTELCTSMSRLAREELRHFEQVRKIMREMNVPFERLSASRYAGGLREAIGRQEPDRLFDSLLVAALIEARSCERFAALIPRLEAPLDSFYQGLLRSEARHFENYLGFARRECGKNDAAVDERLRALKAVEAALIEGADDSFRFHSGVPELKGQREPLAR